MEGEEVEKGSSEGGTTTGSVPAHTAVTTTSVPTAITTESSSANLTEILVTPSTVHSHNVLQSGQSGRRDFFVIYKSPTMISELETDLTIAYWPRCLCLEVICYVKGIVEDTCEIYLDYKQLLNLLPKDQLQDPNESRGASRKKLMIEFLLTRLILLAHEHDLTRWRLAVLETPPRDRYKEIAPSDSAHESDGTDSKKNGAPERKYLDQVVIPKPKLVQGSKSQLSVPTLSIDPYA